jgi:hypothetical protein
MGSPRDWKSVVAGLLRKAEDPAVGDEERELLMDKAVYLAAKYGIEDAVEQNVPENVEIVTVTVNGIYQPKKFLLLHGLARTFGCDVVRLPNGNVQIFGFKADHEKVVMLYDSLLIQMIMSLANAQDEKPPWEHGKAFNNAFINTFVTVVLERVRHNYQRAKDSVGGAELVLKNRNTDVMKKIKETYPKSKMTTYRTTSRSSAGSLAGREAGHKADIGQSRVGGGRKAIGG